MKSIDIWIVITTTRTDIRLRANNPRQFHPSIQWLYSSNRALASSFEFSLSHTYRQTVGLLWTRYQPIAEASTYTGQHNI
jgi:hypothetical protein